MNVRSAWRLAAVIAVLAGQIDAGSKQREPRICDQLVTTLIPQRVFRVPDNQLPRVEIRSCAAGISEGLQLVAWQRGAFAPSLVVDTYRFTVAQLVMSGNAFVIQTAGGTTDVLQVIVYENGKPRLALERFIKGYPTITTRYEEVRIDIPQEDGPGAQVSFPTGNR
jgi:hypothetical protein